MLTAIMIYLGCYTDATHGKGLFLASLDVKTGKIEIRESYPVDHAIYQALSPDGKTLFSCDGAGVSSLAVAGDFTLSPIGRIDVGRGVCHVAAMPDGRRVVFADYTEAIGGSASVDGKGRLSEPVFHRHSGDGPNKPRQDKAHCHQAMPLPDGKGYAVVDLGLDAIVEYPSGRTFKTAPAGAGPRHLLFHPDGRLAFLVYELGNAVASLEWTPEAGFRALDALPTLPDGDTGRGYNGDLASAIRFTPDMKGVVVSNRGENSLATFDFDAATGRLKFKARTLLPGSWPRDFLFVTPELAVATMERSGEVHTLRYDAGTGRFEVVSTLGGLFRPVAVIRADGGRPRRD